MPAWLTVVGIGDDGFAGLGRPARRALLDAAVVFGGERHLAMLPARLAARRAAWPSPFDIAPVLALRNTPVCVLASGDPMLFGVGATLARQLPAAELRVLPAPSSLSLAAARLGWPLQEVTAVSLVGRPLATLNVHLHAGARLFVLSADGATPAALAALLTSRGFGATRMIVLEHLGGERERRLDGRADAWSGAAVAALNLVALECHAADGAPRLPLTPGLPDDAFRHDGQLTKRDVRAVTLARLAPTPGELLWDVGAGSGSIGIEWMRTHPACRAIAIEGHAERQRFIEHNRDALGVPGLQLVAGRAPEALQGLRLARCDFYRRRCDHARRPRGVLGAVAARRPADRERGDVAGRGGARRVARATWWHPHAHGARRGAAAGWLRYMAPGVAYHAA
jgi:precorrin-6Y C5,15-methyltransferase (decarboxylating)